MNVNRIAAHSGAESNPSESTADRLRALLEHAGLSQRAAARLLEIEERTMRQWCAGRGSPPESVLRALNPRLTRLESLCQSIEQNEQRIEAIRDGRLTGFGSDGGPSDPQSAMREIERLLDVNEQLRAHVRWDAAFQRHQEAHVVLTSQWLPHGNGQPTEESLAEVDAAEAELSAAKAELDGLRRKVPGGNR